MNTISAGARSEALRARAIGAGWLQGVGRLGWVAKGVVYVLIGVLTVPIALQGGDGGEEASRGGAIETIAESSFGGILLWLMAFGLILYSLWRLTTATLPGDNSEAETWVNRAAYVGSAVIYGALAWTALSYATGSGSSGGGGESTSQSLSETLLGNTGGRWLLGLGALGAFAVAGYFAYKGATRKFLEDIDLSGAGTGERTIIERLGVIGWIGRAITVALVAVFVLQAALTSNSDEAKGLDAALRETAQDWWGAVLVLVAGVALIAYGVFAAISARRRRLLGP